MHTPMQPGGHDFVETTYLYTGVRQRIRPSRNPQCGNRVIYIDIYTIKGTKAYNTIKQKGQEVPIVISYIIST